MDNTKSNITTFRFAEISRQSMDIFEMGRIVNRLDRCGMFICQEGAINLTIDNKEFDLTKGSAVLYMPSSLLRPNKMSQDARGLMVTIDIDYIIQAVNRVSTIENVLYLRHNPYIMLSESQYQHSVSLLNLMWQKLREIESNEYTGIKYKLAVEIVKSTGEVAFFEILDAFFGNRPESIDSELLDMAEHSKKDMIFFRFLVSLYKNYIREREVNYYADEQSLSSRYFSAIIKEKSGHSALQWIINVVVGEIKQRLETSDMSVKEIAMSMNFPTQSFFGKYFKQYVGVSPKEYRDRMRAAHNPSSQQESEKK